jgi:hypothetical protein
MILFLFWKTVFTLTNLLFTIEIVKCLKNKGKNFNLRFNSKKKKEKEREKKARK